MKKGLNKGFTLIELLVVIAIIGILSGVVLTSLNSARGKAREAAIKANLTAMRAAAEVIYDNNNGNYANVCTSGDAKKQYDAAIAAGGVTTGAGGCIVATDNSVWAAQLRLSSTGQYFCVDSTGNATSTAAGSTFTAGTASTVKCP